MEDFAGFGHVLLYSSACKREVHARSRRSVTTKRQECGGGDELTLSAGDGRFGPGHFCGESGYDIREVQGTFSAGVSGRCRVGIRRSIRVPEPGAKSTKYLCSYLCNTLFHQPGSRGPPAVVTRFAPSELRSCLLSPQNLAIPPTLLSNFVPTQQSSAGPSHQNSPPTSTVTTLCPP